MYLLFLDLNCEFLKLLGQCAIAKGYPFPSSSCLEYLNASRNKMTSYCLYIGPLIRRLYSLYSEILKVRAQESQVVILLIHAVMHVKLITSL